MTTGLFNVTITSENLDFIQNLDQKMREQLLRSATKSTYYLVQEFKRLLSSPGPYTLARRSGRLKNSVRQEPTIIAGNSIIGGLSVGEGVPYAGVHIGTSDETETVITSHGGKRLAIPIGGARTAGGTSRFPLGPKAIPDLFIPRRGTKAWGRTLHANVLYQRRARVPLAMFLLLPSVTVPRRIFTDLFLVAHQAGLNRIIEADLAAALAKGSPVD